MNLTVLLLVGLLLCHKALAQTGCRHLLPFNEILSSQDGVLTIDDEEGAREIKATVYATPDCQTNSVAPTGSVSARNTNLTLLSQASIQPNGCEIKDIGGVLTIDSFQAIVIETNGWVLNDYSMTFEDIDASSGGWREAGTVFGLRNGVFVAPNVSISSDSHLAIKNYNIPASSMDLMGVSLGSTVVPGAGYNKERAINCKTGTIVGTRCRLTVSFPSEIDTLVVVYALVARGSLSTRSGVFLSQLSTQCGCRCRETNPGTRLITVPVPGNPDQCTRKETSGPKTECDVFGSQWCIKEEFPSLTLTGTTLPNGNLGCTGSPGSQIIVNSPFSADPNFEGSS